MLCHALQGMDVPNYAVANGSLYMFGGWRASFAGMQAWQERPDSLYQLGLPVPITIGTNGARLLRYAWRYSAADDAWERLPDVPQHVCSGGTVTLRGAGFAASGNVVTVGGAACAVASENETFVACALPDVAAGVREIALPRA